MIYFAALQSIDLIFEPRANFFAILFSFSFNCFFYVAGQLDIDMDFSFKSWNFPTEFLQQLVNNKGRIFKKSFPLESHLVMLN